MKIGCSGFDEVDEDRFRPVLIDEGSTGEKVIEVLEKMEVVVCWREIWGVWCVRQNLTLNLFNFRAMICETC